MGSLVAAAGRALSVGTGVRLMALAHVPVILTPPAAVLGGCLFSHRLGTGLVYPRLFAALAVRPRKHLRASVVTATTTTLSVTGPAGVLAAGTLLDGGRSSTAALVMIAATAAFGAVVSGW